jgi:Kef-type K+ transport system membrane component KefB
VTDQAFLSNLGLLTVAAAVFALLPRRLGVPSVVAYLLAGLMLGPLTGLAGSPGGTEVVSEAGVVLLLFLVGLELTVDKVKSVGRVAVVAGGAQVLVTVVLAFGCSALLGFAPVPAFVLAVGLTLSSTVVVVKLLVERRESKAVSGQTAIGILLVQDLFVIVLLTVLAGLGSDGGGAPRLEPGAVAGGVGRALVGMALVVAALAVASRYLLPGPFGWASRSRDTAFVWALSWCFLVVLAVHAVGLSAEIGAFLAGVGLAQTPHVHDVQRRVRPLMHFFIAVFFVALGTRMALVPSGSFWAKAVAMSAFVVAGKFAVVFAITRLLGYHKRDAFESALLLTQISEFSLIFAVAAAEAGLIGDEARGLLGVVALITISASTTLVAVRDRLFAWWEARGAGKPDGPGQGTQSPRVKAGPALAGHVIVVGMNTLGRELVRRLHARGETVVAIDTDPAKLASLPGDTLVGDAASAAVMEEASLATARLLVSTLHIDDANDLLAYRAHCARVAFAVHAADLRQVENLMAMDAAYLMTPKADGIREQRRELVRLGILPTK